jgi:hypothetical protein
MLFILFFCWDDVLISLSLVLFTITVQEAIPHYIVPLNIALFNLKVQEDVNIKNDEIDSLRVLY